MRSKFIIFLITLISFLLTMAETSAINPGQKNPETFDFSGRRAYELIKKQCAFGPRAPETPGHDKCRRFIRRELESLGLKVHELPFYSHVALLGKKVRGVNIMAEYTGDNATSEILALSAHWDTRPVAEKDPDPAMRRVPIPGANDGASGTAVLLELARVVTEMGYEGRLLFIFFDLEDSGIQGNPDTWCLGSTHFAENHLDEYPIEAGINFDMIGDRDLKVQPELFMLKKAPEMTRDFFNLAEKSAPFHFSSKPLEYVITDDHTSFLKKNISYINLIDFNYPHWHTQEDTPDKCSPISLQIIGDTALKYLFNRLDILENNP